MYHSSAFLQKIDSINKIRNNLFLKIAVHKFQKCKRENL